MRRGFTLVEVVLALSLTVLLLGSMVTFLWELSDRRSTLARGSRDLHAGTVVLERLEQDLSSGLAGDATIGAGVQGTQTTLKVLSRGVWLAPTGDAAQAGGAGEGDLQVSEYAFDTGAGKLSARRGVIKPGAGGGTGSMEVVSERVERVRFRYYDGTAWRTSFDSLQEGNLPVAIEVAIWFTALKNATTPPPLTSANSPAPAASDLPEDQGAAASQAEPTVDPERRWPAPDRLRVIIVPDGPQTSWKEGG